MAATFHQHLSRIALACVGVSLVAASAVAQSTTPAHHHDASPSKAGSHASHDNEAAADPTAAVHESMGSAMSANPHMRMSPMRTPSASDSARAEQVVATARTAVAKYKDVRVAERDGYRMFAPNIKSQPVYHFTKLGAAIRERFKFDPSQPSSLLYKKNQDGSMRLVGVMYTAPKDATPDQLNARIPLGIAQWHLHTNMCVPRFSERDRWREVKNGKPVFGPASPIATRESCDAVNGKFMPVVFNWMVHVNLFDDDVWGDHHH